MDLKIVTGFALAALVSLINSFSHASEVRYLSTMPDKPSTVNAIKATKKPGYECTYIKTGPHGNANNVKGTASKWFTEVPESDPKADDLLDQGKRAVRCTLKLYDKTKHRMSNADLGDANEG